MNDPYANLIAALRYNGIPAEMHRPDQLVLRDGSGFSSPGWLTWRDGWYACSWGPTCYRVPADADIAAFCEAWRNAPRAAPGATSRLPEQLVDRYGLEQVEYESLDWLSGEPDR